MATPLVPLSGDTSMLRDIDLIEGDLKRAYERLVEGKRDAGLDAVTRTLDVGTLLIAAKLWFAHGQFGKWVKQTMPFTQRWGQIAMRLARHRQAVEQIIQEKSEPGSHSPLSIAKVIAMLDERASRLAGGEGHSAEPRRPHRSRRAKAAAPSVVPGAPTLSEAGQARSNAVIEGTTTPPSGGRPGGGVPSAEPSGPPSRKEASIKEALAEALTIFTAAHSRSATPKTAVLDSTGHTSESPSNMGSQSQGGSTSTGTIT